MLDGSHGFGQGQFYVLPNDIGNGGPVQQQPHIATVLHSIGQPHDLYETLTTGTLITHNQQDISNLKAPGEGRGNNGEGFDMYFDVIGVR